MFKKDNLIVAISILFTIVGAVLLLGRKEWFPDFYNADFMGGVAFISVILVLVPEIIFKTKEEIKRAALHDLQIKIAMALILNGLGALGLFKLYTIGFEFDKFVHFLVAFLLSGEVYYFLGAWYGWDRRKAMIISAAIVFFSGLGWEPIEFLTDVIFDTQTLGMYGKEVLRDTIADICFNSLGIILGLALTFLKKKKTGAQDML